ncbi:MAG TPA: hypothetical protein VG713_13015 [Pirellulales bacterium]|nr:hypothetical protein [Pirellulales bacterium]
MQQAERLADIAAEVLNPIGRQVRIEPYVPIGSCRPAVFVIRAKPSMTGDELDAATAAMLRRGAAPAEGELPWMIVSGPNFGHGDEYFRLVQHGLMLLDQEDAGVN